MDGRAPLERASRAETARPSRPAARPFASYVSALSYDCISMLRPARHDGDLDDGPHEDHSVLLRDATWADYERLLAPRGESSAPRLTYLEGALEITSPSRSHESLKSVIGIDKLDVYRKLGVREVWYWRRGTITPHVLRGERYRAVERSAGLPKLDLAELARFVDLAPPASTALRAYRDALRGRAP